MNNLLLFSLILLSSSSIGSAFTLDANLEGNVAKASMVLGASDMVSVSVETIETPNGYAYSKAYMWGGDETTPPKKIIKAITVLMNGQMVFIPLSAYCDLGNPLKISLEKIPVHGFRLIITGGDAASSYSALLDFKNNEISRRKVISGEFPKEVWEATTFSFNHLNN
jgi:hypothetical protein